ncbi:MAG: pyridoxamine 5'-phosphate oxidase family protein [Chloroflexi bacterium]|nr:pyridoxamine 5'-phosphate oxidase family protein [Chloroflexota bacterium]
MAETRLATVLRRSIAEATPHTKNVFGGAHAMSAREVAEFLDVNTVVLVSTLSASGAPHVTGIGTTFMDGKLYLGLDKRTALHRNLRRNPGIAVAVIELPWKRHVFIQGSAALLPPEGEEIRRVRAKELAKHGWESSVIARISPRKIFTWKE